MALISKIFSLVLKTLPRKTVLAAPTAAPTPFGGIYNPYLPSLRPLHSTTVVARLISTMTTLLLIGGVLATLLYVILGSYQWIMAKGDKMKLQQAKGKVTNAFVALAVLLTIFAIFSLFGHLFGFDILNLQIPSVTNPTTPPGWHCITCINPNDCCGVNPSCVAPPTLCNPG
jgi:hypothetical protein